MTVSLKATQRFWKILNQLVLCAVFDHGNITQNEMNQSFQKAQEQFTERSKYLNTLTRLLSREIGSQVTVSDFTFFVVR